MGMFHSTTSIFWFKATHRVAGHHCGIVDHSDKVDDGEGRVQHIGAEQVLVEGDSLTAQTPVRCNKMLDINMQTYLKLLLWWKKKKHTHINIKQDDRFYLIKKHIYCFNWKTYWTVSCKFSAVNRTEVKLLFIYLFFLRFSPDCHLSWSVWITFPTNLLSLQSTWLLLSEKSGSHDLRVVNKWAV